MCQEKNMRFKNKVLIATGAGSGIAAATARLFTAQGGRVAIMDLDGSRALAVASECDGSIGLACDVSDEKSVQNAVAEARVRLGRIDCVFNAAGYVVHGPIDNVRSNSGTECSPCTSRALSWSAGRRCLPCARQAAARL